MSADILDLVENYAQALLDLVADQRAAACDAQAKPGQGAGLRT